MSEALTLGLLPVRAGSVGIPNKNVRQLGGKPLMAWAGEALVAASSVDLAFCSTESPELAEIARRTGLVANPLRPVSLATSDSMVSDTIFHVLQEQRAAGNDFDRVVLVQATSPFVTPGYIDAAVDMLADPTCDSVISVTEVHDRYHPAKMYREENGRVQTATQDGDSFRRRQDRKTWFRRSGLVYGFRVDAFLKLGSIVGEKVRLLKVETARDLDIDDEEDFQAAIRSAPAFTSGWG